MADIIHLFGEPEAIEGVPKSESGQYCNPHSPLIDKTTRLVTCARCKGQLDPVDALLQVADQHERWTRLLEETRTLRKEVVALKAEEKRVKARTKAHSRKDATEAVAVERAKDMDRRIEVIVRTGEIRRAIKRIDQLMGKRDPA